MHRSRATRFQILLWSLWLLLQCPLHVASSFQHDTVPGRSPKPPPECDRGKDSKNRHRYDPLACWLWKLKATIPDQKIKESIFTVTIKDMVCTNFTIDDIDSIYNPSKHPGNNSTEDPTISVAVQGISATCVGKYKSTGMSGTVRASVISKASDDKNDAALGLTVTFVSSMYDHRIRMATGVSTDQCRAELKVPKDGLVFTGSMSAKLINLFSSHIAKYVSSALSSQLCPALQPVVEEDLGRVLKQVDDYLIKHVLPMNATTLMLHVNNEDDFSEVTAIQRDRRAQLRTTSQDGRVDWSRDTPLLHSLLELANKFLDRYLDKGFLLDLLGRFGFGKEEEGCGYFFRGLNGVFGSLTKDGTVRFGVPKFLPHLRNITFVLPKYAKVSVLVDQVSIHGVDQLTQINLLRPIDNVTFGFVLRSTNGFNVTVAMRVEVQSTPGGMFQGDPLMESFQILFNSSHVGLDGHVSFGYTADGLSQIAVGDVLSTIESAIHHNLTGTGCLLAPMQSIQLGKLGARMNVLGASFLPDGDGNAGQLEKDLDRMLNTFLKLFLGEYDVLVSDSVAGLLDGPARDILNDFLKKQIPALVPDKDEAHCGNWSENEVDFFDFDKHKIFGQMNRFLNKSSTLGVINEYITCLADTFNRDIGSKSYSMNVEGVELQMQNVALDNLGTLDRIELFAPQDDGFHVGTDVAFSTCDNHSTNCHIPKLSVSFYAHAVSAFNLSSQLNVSALFGDSSLSIDSLIHYDVGKLRALGLQKFLANGYCALLPSMNISTEGSSAGIGNLHLAISSILASSVFNTTTIALDSDNFPQVDNLTQSTMSWILASIQDSSNGFFSATLPRTESLCYGTEGPRDVVKDLSEPWSLAVYIVVGVIILIAHVSFWFLRMHKESRDDFGEEDLTSPFLEAEASMPEETLEATRDSPMNKTDGSLLAENTIPRVIRHGFPVAVVATTAILLSSNVSTGASVNVVLTFDDYPTISLPSIFAFSLGNTISEMYAAGVYPLLAIVVIFSGIWPYMKLALMLYAWLAPKTEMNIHQRGRLLFLLDSLSKFSLVDTFVLVLMMVSFRFHLGLDGLPMIDVYVDPSFGFYGFLLATTLSLLAGHFALFYHRRSQATAEATTHVRESLSQHQYGDNETDARHRMSSSMRVLVFALLTLSFVFLAIGSTKKSFGFEFRGLAGALLSDDRRKYYSLLTLGSSLPQSVQDPSSMGIFCLQIAYYFYALIMPLACLLTLTILVYVPLTLRAQRRVLAVVEICNAWSAIEVFLLSITAALLQIGTFASFMIGDKCDLINSFLQEYFDDALDGDDICYMVKASVTPSIWYLVCGVVVNSFVVSSMLRFAHCAMEERYQRETNVPQDDEDPLSSNRAGGAKQNIVSMLLASRMGKFVFAGRDDRPERELTRSDSVIWEVWRNMTSWT